MAKDTKLSGGTIPGTNLPHSEPSEFDKFQAANMNKAVIGIPKGDDGVNPISNNGGAPPPPANVLELPQGVTPQQAAQMQAAFAAIVSGKAAPQMDLPPVVPQAAQHNPQVQVSSVDSRAWNPYTPFQPSAKLSDMEASVGRGAENPMAVMPNAPVSVKLSPKIDCSPVLIDCWHLLNSLQAGRWILQGGPSVQTMLVRLKGEIEGS